MSAWGTEDLAQALPEANAPAASPATAPPTFNVNAPQEHGWVKTTPLDYDTYNKSGKDLQEEHEAQQAAQSNGTADWSGNSHTWASSAAVYEFNPEEYGDIGPRFPSLEEDLFKGANNTRTGINFNAIQSIEVTQEGVVRLDPCRSFENAGLHPVMLENLKLAGYTVPTPIQQYCFPAVFKGHDIVACAQTGSGKTAAFLIPTLSKCMGKAKKWAAPRPNPATYRHGIDPPVTAEPLILIVCNSRELASQIFNETRKFCYRSMLRPAAVYGGAPISEQISILAKGADILIGTPGRLIDFINRPAVLSLQRLKYMIIDEADEMLHSDWQEDLKKIMEGGNQDDGNVKYLMFSATFPKEMRELAREHLAHDHVRIRVGRAGSSHTNITQDIVFVAAPAKRQALEDLLLSAPPSRTLIFVNSKRAADELDDYLFNRGFPCVSIHGGRTQLEREDCVRAFRSGKTPILIATGVSSRGIDIPHIMHVINYDLPSTAYGGIEEYTHRIGRTGRIGNRGLATSFYNERDEDIAEALTKTLLETRQVVPDFLEPYIPEGFTAAGDGDIAKLKFEADSDDENEDQNPAQSSAVDGSTGTSAIDTGNSGWGAPTAASPTVKSEAVTGWGASTSTPTVPTVSADSGWGAPTAGGGW